MTDLGKDRPDRPGRRDRRDRRDGRNHFERQWDRAERMREQVARDQARSRDRVERDQAREHGRMEREAQWRERLARTGERPGWRTGWERDLGPLPDWEDGERPDAYRLTRLHERHQQMRLERLRWRQEMWRLRQERRAHGRTEAREHALAVRRGLRFAWWSLRTWPAAIVLPFGLATSFLRPPTIRLARLLAGGQRGLLEKELGTGVPRGQGAPDAVGLRDPQVRRDVRWLLCAPLLGLLALLPAALFTLGLGDLAWWLTGHGFLGQPELGWWLIPIAFALGNGIAPPVVEGYKNMTLRLLSPNPTARLEQRVRRLTETRADAVDTQAAELRRIERDLHDGVQARLVAMGLNLGAAERLMESDPAAAKALLAQSREASASALQELRGLVRGIHPPVLAERGLADAIQALALDSPLRTEVAEDLPGRAEAPVESAVYFAVSELLTNAARHARAERVWIDLHHTGEALRVQVTDDGRGGAEPGAADGSGLCGIERRLGTFDGVMAISSPPGGPTIVTLEVPCALSSPKTCTSSEKA